MSIEGTAPDAPSAKAVRRAEEAREELAAAGLGVSVRTLGTGFALRLNQRAAEHLATPEDPAAPDRARGLVSEVLAGSLPAAHADLVHRTLPARAARIRAAARGAGCELLSPRTLPALLAPVPLDATLPGTELWFGVLEPGAGQGPSAPFTTGPASETPALALFRGDLHCVYQGPGEDPALWWTIHRADGSAPPARPLPDHHTLGGPALAVFKDRLYCAHRGGSGDWGIAVTSCDGTDWTPDLPVPGAASVYGPALAVFRDTLHLAYAEAGQQIMLTTSEDGHHWTAPRPVPDCRTTRSPALAVYDDALHLLFGNPEDASVRWSRLRGAAWSLEGALPGHHTRSTIGLAVLDGRLVCVHRDRAVQRLRWSALDGTRWTEDTEIPGLSSKYGPAPVVLRDPTGARDQLLCVYRGHARHTITEEGEVLTEEDPAGLHELDDLEADPEPGTGVARG
ncbi:sialidase family protein (plasmid) [Streptomyces sp. BI20]|uniref:sialidase family protein n=1 Tax=Streptomyces sp. BI20 TaxID=3403460 RepID=UPI003C776C80